MADKKPQRPEAVHPEIGPNVPALRPEQARARFRQLILANPNYFGNVKGSPFPPILPILSDSSFEEIGCVGYQPEMNRLEAVVFVKKDGGYGGGICTAGTPEYVRFYVSFDSGATWQDKGLNSFTAYDVPGPKPLEYDVSVDANLGSTFCFFESLPLVRAILSWNNPPPPNTPDFHPVWGNVVEAHIQRNTFQIFPLGELFTQAKIELPDPLKNTLDLSQTVSVAEPKTLGISELHALYKDTKVPAHRFLFPEVQKLVATPALTESVMTAGFKGTFAGLGIDIGNVIGTLFNTDGDTSFEQLDCIGLSNGSGVPDALVGILTVKLPNGYSGGLCTNGSQENVAFWVDYGDGAGFTYAGTASVNVHDLSKIPAGGVKYAVVLPIDLTCRRQPCGKGPKTAKVRAILAWEQLPPPGNPDFIPTWGNRKETTILMKPGPACNLDDHTPYIDTVGDMAVCDINQITGLATGGGVIAGFSANESPFGGEITITGFILNPPNVIAGAAPFKYKLFVREGGGGWQPLSNTFNITITEDNGGGVVQFNSPQAVDGGGYYTYREQIFPNQWTLVAGRVLGKWFTGQPMTGMWEIRIEALLPGNITLNGGIILCLDGTTRSSVKLYLDEVAPTPHIQITGFERGGGGIKPAVNCGTFQKGDILHGTYSVSDEHFNALTMHVEPVAPAHGATVNPSARSYPVVPTTGEAGTWTLDTTPMDACGYIVRLDVSDRTIVNSGFIGWPNSDSTGFCLVKP